MRVLRPRYEEEGEQLRGALRGRAGGNSGGRRQTEKGMEEREGKKWRKEKGKM